MRTSLAASLFYLSLTEAFPLVPRSLLKAINQKRQDWGAIDWGAVHYDFSGVDWATVNYNIGSVEATPIVAAAVEVTTYQTEFTTYQTTTIQQVAGNVQGQAAQATTFTTAYTTTISTPTPVAAGNVVVEPTVAAAPVVVAPQVVASSSSGKRGVGWDPSSDPASAAKFAGTGSSWYFNWSPSPSSGMPSNWEFYANIWGTGGIENLANVLTGTPKLIGFNEPDSATQANIAVADAIGLYYQYLVPLKAQGKISQLGTPAVTNSWNAGQGLNWLSSFVSGCNNCGLDFAVVHWYAESLDDFKNHVTQAHQMTGLPVNVAEFAYTVFNPANEPSEGEVMAFMTEAIAWLDAQSFVVAYAWFGSMFVSESKYPGLGSANSLIKEDLSGLTALGDAY